MGVWSFGVVGGGSQKSQSLKMSNVCLGGPFIQKNEKKTKDKVENTAPTRMGPESFFYSGFFVLEGQRIGERPPP